MARKQSEEMYLIIEEYLSGDETADSVCKRHSINKSVFYYWYRKYQDAVALGSDSSFIPLDFSVPKNFSYELELRSGIKLRSEQIFPATYILELIRTGC